jgi:hypothetical protein
MGIFKRTPLDSAALCRTVRFLFWVPEQQASPENLVENSRGLQIWKYRKCGRAGRPFILVVNYFTAALPSITFRSEHKDFGRSHYLFQDWQGSCSWIASRSANRGTGSTQEV